MKNRNLQVVEKVIGEANVALGFVGSFDFGDFNKNGMLKRAAVEILDRFGLGD